MTRTVKDKVLIGIARHGTVTSPKQLTVDAETDIHNISHILWRLQKDGLITFREVKSPPVSIPTKIRLTPAGKRRYEELTR